MSRAPGRAGRYATAAGRWAGVGPYYAMFPTDFADKVVKRFTRVGDRVLDPFTGRASSVFSAAVRGRTATGIEINPVGWVYGQTKLAPAQQDSVEVRIAEIARMAASADNETPDDLPDFFHLCFSSAVLGFLLAARRVLDWVDNPVDRTAMAFILIYLHGKRKDSLSNQMRQSKAMSPDYSVRWWEERNLEPPYVDPEVFLRERIRWRYKMGLPSVRASQVILGDSCDLMESIRREVLEGEAPRVKLLFTSPPYYGVTNYYYDQWLRIWMLGGPSKPSRTGELHKGKFEAKIVYENLLKTVFGGAAEIMDEDSWIYVRTDAREFTLSTTLTVLEESFPGWSITATRQPFKKHTQTALFGDAKPKPGEVDIVLKSPA